MNNKPLVKIFTRTRRDLSLHGFAVHDDIAFQFVVSDDEKYSPCDVAVFYGSNKPGLTTGKGAIKSSIYTEHKGPKVIVETGFTGRTSRPRGLLAPLKAALSRKGKAFAATHRLHRVGVDGVFGDEADFFNRNSPSDRWRMQAEQFGIVVRPYRKTGNHILLVGQVPGDASLRGISMTSWIAESAKEIRALSDRPIHLRLHPNMNFSDIAEIRQAVTDVRDMLVLPIGLRPISKDLEDCWVCVMHSSSASVDALIAGIPTLCLSPANIAYDICGNSIAQILTPPQPERDQWFNDLAYAQWSPIEIAAGKPWWHLRPRIVELLEKTG